MSMDENLMVKLVLAGPVLVTVIVAVTSCPSPSTMEYFVLANANVPASPSSTIRIMVVSFVLMYAECTECP